MIFLADKKRVDDEISAFRPETLTKTISAVYYKNMKLAIKWNCYNSAADSIIDGREEFLVSLYYMGGVLQP